MTRKYLGTKLSTSGDVQKSMARIRFRRLYDVVRGFNSFPNDPWFLRLQ